MRELDGRQTVVKRLSRGVKNCQVVVKDRQALSRTVRRLSNGGRTVVRQWPGIFKISQAVVKGGEAEFG